MYRRRHSGLLRAAAWAASTSKNRNKELPCLLMCPSRCLPALESSLGIIPTYVPICLPQWNRAGTFSSCLCESSLGNSAERGRQREERRTGSRRLLRFSLFVGFGSSCGCGNGKSRAIVAASQAHV